MDIRKGMVVRSTAGHDKGELLLVVGFESNMALICDGRQRPLERPKKKNPKHIQATSYELTQDEIATNRRLKKALFHLEHDN